MGEKGSERERERNDFSSLFLVRARTVSTSRRVLSLLPRSLCTSAWPCRSMSASFFLPVSVTYDTHQLYFASRTSQGHSFLST